MSELQDTKSACKSMGKLRSQSWYGDTSSANNPNPSVSLTNSDSAPAARTRRARRYLEHSAVRYQMVEQRGQQRERTA